MKHISINIHVLRGFFLGRCCLQGVYKLTLSDLYIIA